MRIDFDYGTALQEANQLVHRGLSIDEACRQTGLPRKLFRVRTSRRFTEFLPTPAEIAAAAAELRRGPMGNYGHDDHS
ncbi:hypothetical protein NHH03_22385 [Stieleria sp. TO1_6]|uniref:hypothetical protein n=1 Tax=Stieleria tagensis TaxID=2956795 RepID=UPI00209B4624|nr:hypothetical protein [Stieleria tagensis]MCO8124504.1 hypothetical protein [Stieleria tagensis]